MKRLVLALFVFLSGCAQYALVEQGPQKVKAITVTPSQEWNRVPSMASPGGIPTWTADGISLNSIAFFSEIKGGDPLIRSSKDEEYPIFRADMLPTELVDLIEATVAKLYKATISKSGQLRPLTIGGTPGFEHNFEFVTPDELTRKAYVAGALKEKQLHLIFYQAARMHYYDRHFDSVSAMVETATLE